MLAASVHLTHVNGPEFGAEEFEYEVRLGHGAVDLARVADIKAERRFRQLNEDLRKLPCCSADGLPLIVSSIWNLPMMRLRHAARFCFTPLYATPLEDDLGTLSEGEVPLLSGQKMAA